MEYHILPSKELRLICKERGIKYIASMNKAEMVYILQRNDDDSSINVHIIVQDREQEKMRKRRLSDDYKYKEKQSKWNRNKMTYYSRVISCEV